MKKTTSWSFVAAAAVCAAVFTVGQIDDADARGGGRGGGGGGGRGGGGHGGGGYSNVGPASAGGFPHIRSTT